MTAAELAARVERLAAPGSRLWSQDGRGFRLRDVAFFEAKEGATLAWLAGEEDHGLVVKPNLNALQRLGQGLFVRCHRNFLAAVDRITDVAERYPEDPGAPDEVPRRRRPGRGPAADECELIIDGTERRIPVTFTYAKGVKKALGLGSLHHLVPEHPTDKKLRALGITDFGWRELYKLDPADAHGVGEFTKAWRIVKFDGDRMRAYFRQAGVNQVDKRRLAKSIIFQNWRWIQKGIQPRFKGNIRTFWYEVKNALGGDEILAPDDVDMFYDALRELIEDQRLFRYKDFGFFDMKQMFRGIGAKRPEIVLVHEKAGQSETVKEFAAEVGASYICLGGEPSVLTMEYFSDDLKAAIGDRSLSLFIVTDINPSGVSIRNNFVQGMVAQGLPVARTVVLWESKDVSDATLPGSKAWVVRYEKKGATNIPIKPATMSQVTKALRWYDALGDTRLMTEQSYAGGKLVVTIWGIDSDTANPMLLRRRFLEGVAQIPRR